jgi:hypothetical protein
MSQLDRDHWKRTYAVIKRQARRLRNLQGPLLRSRYSDILIAAMYFWGVLQDRPMVWAADAENYNRRFFRPRKLPSRSQFCRRVDSERFRTLLAMIHHQLVGLLDPADGGLLDGKPLVVGPASKDKDAKRGPIMGGFAKGYKLHIWATLDRRIALWSVMPLNVGEQPVAKALIARMPEFNCRALTLADGNYDSRHLYEALDHKNGGLLAKPRGMDLLNQEPWRVKQAARHPKSKPDGRARAVAMEAWKALPEAGAFVYRDRIHVEGILSNLCCVGGGLGPLPAWVRGIDRVRRWVGAKIILYHARFYARAARGEAA